MCFSNHIYSPQLPSTSKGQEREAKTPCRICEAELSALTGEAAALVMAPELKCRMCSSETPKSISSEGVWGKQGVHSQGGRQARAREAPKSWKA